MNTKQPIETRFWKKVMKTNTCWNWIGSTALDFVLDSTPPVVRTTAVRYSYELHFGPIKRANIVEQTCGNKLCVNPAHLQLVITFKSIIAEVPTEKLAKIVANNDSFTAILKEIGANSTPAIDDLKLRLARDNIDTSHLTIKQHVVVGRKYNRLTAIAPAGKDKHGHNLWLFQCECGNQTTTPSSRVVKGKTKSCGCLVRGGITRQMDRHPITGAFLSHAKEDEPGWMQAARSVWCSSRHYYNEGCPFEDFLRLSQEPCYYCGTTEKLNHAKRKGETFLYNGLDRLDPSRDHSLDNVVPCCKDCNYGKHTKRYEKFLLWVDRVYHHSQAEISRVKNLPASPLFCG